MLVVICEGLLGVDDHGDEWPVPYRHQISVTPDLASEAFTLQFRQSEICLPAHWP